MFALRVVAVSGFRMRVQCAQFSVFLNKFPEAVIGTFQEMTEERIINVLFQSDNKDLQSLVLEAQSTDPNVKLSCVQQAR